MASDSSNAEQTLRAALAASEARYRTLLDNIPLPTFVYDVQTLRFLAVSQEAVLQYGYSREEFLSMRVTDIRPPEDVPRLLETLTASTGEMARRGVWRHRRKDGSIFEVDVVSRGTTPEDSQRSNRPPAHNRIVVCTPLTNLRRLEDAVRENEERFRVAFQTIPDAMNIGRLEDGVTILVNDGFCRLTGWSQEEAVGTTSSALGLWVDLALRDELFATLRREGFVRDREVRFRARSGVEFIGLLSSRTFNSGGKSYFLTVARDITERNRAERAQAAIFRIAQATETPGTLQQLLGAIHGIVAELMPAPNFYIALYDATSHLLEFPYYVDESGDLPAGREKLGKGLTELVLRTGKPVVFSSRAEFDDLARTGEVEQVGVPSASWVGVPLMKQQRTVGVLAAQIYTGPARYGQREKELLQFVSTQVAHAIERKQAEENLRKSEQRFRALIENTSDGICLLAANGDIAYCTSAATRIFGSDQTEVHAGETGHPLGTLLNRLHPEDQAPVRLALAEAVRKPGVPVLMQARARAASASKDGTAARPALTGAVIEGVFTNLLDDPAVRGIVLNVRDVSERTQMEAKLMMADRMVSVGTLAAGVAHEINNPLAYVLANLSYLADTLQPLIVTNSLSRDVVEALTEAQSGADRVRNIVRDLKTFSRADEIHDGPIDLHHILDAAANMAWNEVRHRARLVKDYAPRLPLVLGNESRLGQVFLNLLINAAQAVPEGATERNEIRITTRAEGTRIIVDVRDSGAGISLEARGRLFDPFFTTKPVGVGTGLGLFICQNIITALGGEITADSEPGRGAVFHVALPAALEEQSLPVVLTALPPTARRGRVLVIDDEALIGTALRRGLSAHEVVAETSAVKALARLRNGERFDLMLCDVMMPEMTGTRLWQVLHDEKPELADQLVFMTGGAFTQVARDFLDRVQNVRMEKPLDLHNVRALINSRLR